MRKLLLASLWFGLFAGILEAAVRFFGGKPDASVEILWIAPVFNVGLFLALGSVLALLSRMIRKADVRLALALFVGIVFFGALFSVEILGKYPPLILALGIGVQARRSILGREQAIFRGLRATLPILLIFAVGLAGAGAIWPHWQERRLLAQLPPPTGGPNIILITADTLRADHVSAHGYARDTTPFLDRLSKDSAWFEAAFANSSWTLPSHASMFTGRLPHEHRADWQQPLTSRFPTLAEALSGRGYLTAAFTANREYVTPEWGLGRGFSHFEVFSDSVADYAVRTVYGKRLALNVLPRLGFFDIPGRKSAAQLNQQFLNWLDRAGKKPFFAFLNYMEVHDPYLAPDGYSTRFSNNPCRGDRINFQFGVTFRRRPTLSEQEIQQEIDGYDASLAYLDRQLEQLFGQLQARRLLDNTIVIFTSDHGEAFGNHTLFGHGNSLYRETLHIPLFLHWPGRIPARRISTVVGLSQLPATVMALIGERPAFPGVPLTDFWNRSGSEHASVPVLADLRPGRFEGGPGFYPNAREGWSSLINQDWHLLVSDGGKTELYAWQVDPDENHDLANDSSQKQVIGQLVQQLSAARGFHYEISTGN